MIIYLVAAEPKCVPSLRPLLNTLGAAAVHSCAWVLPWQGSADSLRDHFRPSVPPGTRLVVAEAQGDWSLL